MGTVEFFTWDRSSAEENGEPGFAEGEQATIRRNGNEVGSITVQQDQRLEDKFINNLLPKLKNTETDYDRFLTLQHFEIAFTGQLSLKERTMVLATAMFIRETEFKRQ